MVRIQPDPPGVLGGLAQLGEHLLCKQGVVGSIPSSSTIYMDLWGEFRRDVWACGQVLTTRVRKWGSDVVRGGCARCGVVMDVCLSLSLDSMVV